MIQVESGKELDGFISYVENAIGVLSSQHYALFLSMFDSSLLTEHDLILALRYLDETRPILKVDNPILEEGGCRDFLLIPFRNGRGYHMDYDLTTDGKRNDLTIQIDFLKRQDEYSVILENLCTL